MPYLEHSMGLSTSATDGHICRVREMIILEAVVLTIRCFRSVVLRKVALRFANGRIYKACKTMGQW